MCLEAGFWWGFGGLSTETGEGQGRGFLVFGNLYNLRGTESHGWQGFSLEMFVIYDNIACHL